MKQSRKQSRLEVAVDTAFLLLINILGQMFAYGMLATSWRAGTFAGATLLLAAPRRYATRRFFNRFVSETTGQTPQQSWVEMVTDTLLAFATSVVLQLLWYGSAATWSKIGGLTLGVYLLTMVRRYLLRRVFQWWERRKMARHLVTREVLEDASHLTM